MKSGKTLMELALEIERRSNAKRDVIVSTKNLKMAGDASLTIAGQEPIGVNKIAHAQIAEHSDIPKKYYDRMLAEAPDLLANNVNKWFAKYPAERMVRQLDGGARAFLSNKYRPMENEDLAAAVLPPLAELGLDVMSSEITDTRLYIKAVDPKVTRELEKANARWGSGHTIIRIAAPAIVISNSEVGYGSLSIQAGIFDSFCSNLAMFGESSMKRYHVGGKHEIAGDALYAVLSEKTQRLTDAALWAQVTDVVRNAFNRERFDALVDKIEGTVSDKIEGNPVKTIELGRRKFGLTEGEGTSILRQLIEGADLTRFGLYNAVTRAAADVEDYDRATQLERLGGQIIELPQSEWRELALAA